MKKIFKDKKLIIVIVVALLLIVIGVVAIVNRKEKPVEPPVVEEEEEEVVLPESKIKIVNTNSKTRPYAVMINNLDPARKYQSGLQDAYIVYEMIVEGGITRMMALFKDKTVERTGPIRSARHYFLDYVLENDAIYVHDGWSPQAQSDISTLGINNINPSSAGVFWREDLPVAYEHTEFTKIANIAKAVKSRGYRTETNKELLLNYSEEEVDLTKIPGNKVANTVDIKYSNYTTTNYIYNKTEKVYYRSVKDVKHIDYVTNKQYTAKNVIIEYVVNKDIEGDTEGRQTLNNIGTGSGFYITDGFAVPITWEKTSRGEQTVYKYTNGNEIDVNDGNTFIQIAPINSATIK